MRLSDVAEVEQSEFVRAEICNSPPITYEVPHSHKTSFERPESPSVVFIVRFFGVEHPFNFVGGFRDRLEVFQYNGAPSGEPISCVRGTIIDWNYTRSKTIPQFFCNIIVDILLGV